MRNISKEPRIKKSYEYVKDELRKRNIKLISTDYKNNKTLLDVECLVEGCDKTWKATFNNMTSKNSLCPRCSNNEHVTNEIIDELIIKRNIPVKRLEDISKSLSSHKWLCLKCGYVINCSCNRLFKYHKKKFGCKGCAGLDRRVTVEQFDKRIFKFNPYIKRLGEFSRVGNHVEMVCLECGNTWNPPAAEIYYNNTGCPNCSKARGERFTGDILARLFPNQVNDQYKFKANGRNYFIDYELEINGKQYFIEYNGKQHYEPVKFWGHVLEFDKQQKRDNEVKEYCKLNNIELIIIKYDINFGDIEEMLLKRIAN